VNGRPGPGARPGGQLSWSGQGGFIHQKTGANSAGHQWVFTLIPPRPDALISRADLALRLLSFRASAGVCAQQK